MSVRGILSGGWLSALQERLVGTGEDIRLQGPRPILLAALFVALGIWLLNDEAELEQETLVAPSMAALHEETAGVKEAQEGKAVADPFSLLHSDEQATLAAMVALGGSTVSFDNLEAAEKRTDTANAGSRKDGAATAPSGTVSGKTGNGIVVPQVRGTVTSNVGTVLLLSVGGHDLFLAEGEEKEGVLLQSLSEKSAVVVVGGRSYTLNLPG